MSPVLLVVLLSAVLGVVRVWSYRRRGHGVARALGLHLNWREIRNAGVGTGIAFAAVGATFLVAYTTGSITFSGVGSAAPLAEDLLSFVMVPLQEELVFRSCLLGGLLILLPERKAVGIGISAAIFGGLHMLNPHATLLSGLGSTLGGITYGIAFVATEAVWLPFGLHFGWNYALGPLFGFSLSGGKPARGTFVQQENVGSVWVTGGEYGPEGGVLGLFGHVLVFLLLIVLLAHVRQPDPMRQD